MQRDNMPEGTDSIIEGASGASSSTSTGDFGSGGYGSAGSGGTGMTGGASGAGLSSGATGGIGGANTGGGLSGDYGSSSGTTGLGGASGGSMGSSGEAMGSTGSMGTDNSTSGSTGSTGGISGGMQNLKSQAGDKARQAAMQGKDRATDALGNVSTLVRDAGQMIDGRLGGGYGDYARKAADAVDSFTDGLRGKEVDEIFEDAKNLVRKSPGVALGIAATVGFVLVRALKAGTEGASTSTSTATAANDGATPPLVSDRGGVA